jgi:hypothetical protein
MAKWRVTKGPLSNFRFLYSWTESWWMSVAGSHFTSSWHPQLVDQFRVEKPYVLESNASTKRNTWCNVSVRQRSELLREPIWKCGHQILLREPLSIPATAARDCSSSFWIFVLTQLLLKKTLFGDRALTMSGYKQTPDFRCWQKIRHKKWLTRNCAT